MKIRSTIFLVGCLGFAAFLGCQKKPDASKSSDSTTTTGKKNSQSEELRVEHPTWSSNHFGVTATLLPGWNRTDINQPGDTFDNPEGVLASFVDKKGPYSYMIKISRDVSFAKVPKDEYLEFLRSKYQSHPAYQFIEESDVKLNDRDFHQFKFVVEGSKGPAVMAVNSFRDEQQNILVQWTYPVPDKQQHEIPESIKTFIKGTSIKKSAKE